MITKLLQSNLKELLAAKRMSIREFSRRIDYRFDAVRLLHNNELKRIPAELIERTCTELKITPNDLFTIVTDEEETK